MGRVMKKNKPRQWVVRGRLSLAMVMAAVFLVTGCGLADEEEPFRALNLEEDTEVRIHQLSSFCSVQIEGHGAVDVENDYLPSVVACENGNAPLEALKAQAVAARTYAAFITTAENRPLQPTTADQVYQCDYAEVTDLHRQAVRETAGQVLVHGDRLIAGFYVAGAIPSGSSCQAGSGDSDPTNTEQYVTFNEGLTGGNVQPTSLGHPANPANRGAKSQNGATCMANAGWDYERILRAYYGDDIRARVAEESQCAGQSPDGGSMPPGSGEDVCNIAPATASSTPGCVDPSQTPNILPRSSWNARTPNANRSHHTPNRISVHHTVTPNEAGDGAHWVNQIQLWHMNQGWADIGYHFLISWDGTIYRGNPENRMGAHVGNDNSGNLGIALIGSYHQNQGPSDAQIQSLAQMLRYLGDKYDIDLNRDRVKGHGEWPGQATQCPGTHLRNQLDQVVHTARADATCTDVNEGGGASGGTDVDEFKYVRVQGVSNSPTADNDVVEGFEVDAIYVERGGDFIPASQVLCSPGASNPGAALGEPDNASCDDRPQTVAGVPEGADLVVELSKPAKVGDILFVTQASYNPAMASCEPTGTAKIMVSNDGRNWKVLDSSARGNWRQTLDESDFVFDGDDVTDGEYGFEFIAPKAGESYTPDVTFKVLSNHPEIVEVEYFVPEHAEDVIDDDWTIGTSTNQSNSYEVFYEIQYFGERTVAARGLDAQGNEVVRKEIVITVTDYDGTIPEGQTENTQLADGTNYDQSMGNLLAQEGGKCYDPASGGARCQNGTGGFSTGHCWRFVKRALERAGVSWALLDSTGPCTTYRFHLSAYGFRCNADPNPNRLAQMGFQRVSMAPTEAPAGAIIAWDRGCAGYHAVHGHIEISMGNGVACSDYCGNIRSGGASCASVYVPVN